MFNKILLALDPYEPEGTLFEQALQLAHANKASLMLLSVLTSEVDSAFVSPTQDWFGEAYSLNDWNLFQESYQIHKEKSLNLLRNLTQQATDQNINTEFAQASGSPGRAICHSAETWGADLIMVGSHQRKGLSEMILGSVSNYVLHHAPCSTLVIHGKAMGESPEA